MLPRPVFSGLLLTLLAMAVLARAQMPASVATNANGNVYAATAPGQFSAAVQGVPARVYVPNELDGTLSIVDAHTYKVIGQVPADHVPEHVAPGWDLKTLYIEGDNRVIELNPRTGKTGASHPVVDPYNLYFTPDGREAIAVAELHERLDFYDRATWRPTASVRIPWAGVSHLDFSADGAYLVASTEYSGMLAKVDLSTHKVTATLKLGGMPVDVRLDPGGKVFYVTNQDRMGVSVVDPAHMKEIAFLPTGKGAHGLAVSRDGKELFVSNRLEGSISVLDLASRKIVKKWRVGGSPDMEQVSPDGRELWYSNRFGTTVSVVDTASGKKLHDIAVGHHPHGLAYFPQPGRYSLGHNGVYR